MFDLENCPLLLGNLLEVVLPSLTKTVCLRMGEYAVGHVMNGSVIVLGPGSSKNEVDVAFLVQDGEL